MKHTIIWNNCFVFKFILKCHFCDQSWIFSIIPPGFTVTWSFRNHSNMLIWCSRNISDYYIWKENNLCDIEIFCNIINLFTANPNHFNGSLLKKIFFRKPSLWMGHKVFFTFPKMVCLLLSSSARPRVKKNWLPLSWGPAFAIATKPLRLKRNLEWNSSCIEKPNR